MEYYIITLILAIIKISLLLLFLYLRCRRKNKVPEVGQNPNLYNECYQNRQHGHPRHAHVSVININERYSAATAVPPPPYLTYKEESLPVPIVTPMDDADHLPSYSQVIADAEIANHLKSKS